MLDGGFVEGGGNSGKQANKKKKKQKNSLYKYQNTHMQASHKPLFSHTHSRSSAHSHILKQKFFN